MRIIKFDIWGDYGHFKKFYTTSSPLTFSIPPITAIYGIIGAILGYNKYEYMDILTNKGIKVAVGIKEPIKKIRMGLNWIETKRAGQFFNAIRQRTQIKVEFLKNPIYTLWITGNGELLDELWSFISNHKSFYTPYLGISECIANFGNPEEIEGRSYIPNDYITVKPEEIYLKEVLSHLGINREQLIIMGILIGTDFDKGVRGVGPKTALKIVKTYEDFDKVKVYVREKYNHEFESYIDEVFDFFLHPPHKDVEITLPKLNEEKVVKILVDRHDFSHDRVTHAISELKKALEKDKQTTLKKWF